MLSIDFSTVFIGLPSFEIVNWERHSELHWTAYLEPVHELAGSILVTVLP